MRVGSASSALCEFVQAGLCVTWAAALAECLASAGLNNHACNSLQVGTAIQGVLPELGEIYGGT